MAHRAPSQYRLLGGKPPLELALANTSVCIACFQVHPDRLRCLPPRLKAAKRPLASCATSPSLPLLPAHARVVPFMSRGADTPEGSPPHRKLLCERIIDCLERFGARMGLPPNRNQVVSLHEARAAAQHQPRGVASQSDPPLDSKNCLASVWCNVPAGSSCCERSKGARGDRSSASNSTGSTVPPAW